MDEIVSTVIDYVKKENTDYALMINGNWGSGKTYFWENTLRPKIEEQKIQDKNLKTIYISLYGIESLSEISKSIFYEIYSSSNEKLKKFSDSRVGNVLSEMGKLAINVGGGLLNLSLPKDDDIDYGKFFNIENRILCFDDLERANIDIAQILGFINNFVEHDKTKVIFLCNENEITNNLYNKNLELKSLVSSYLLDKQGKLEISKTPKKQVGADEKVVDTKELINETIVDIFDKSNNYKKIKEKLIGKTLTYKADYRIIIQSIIESFKNPDFTKFLKENSDVIFNTFQISETYNIRILKQALWDFETIYLNSSRFRSTVDRTVFQIMLRFTISLSLEIKSGNLMPNTFQKINTYAEIQSEMVMNRMLGNNELSTKEKFFNKYFSSLSLTSNSFFKSIEKLIREGVLDKELLETELENVNKVEIMPSYQKIIRGFWELSDEEFKQAEAETYQDILNGNLHFSHYFRLFVIYLKLIDMKLISIHKHVLKHEFILGLQKASEKAVYDENLDVTFITVGDLSKNPDLLELKEKIFDINKQLLLKKEISEALSIIEVIKNNPSKGLQELRSQYSYKPFFYYCNPLIFFEDIIKTMTNEEITILRNFILDRHKYRDENLLKDYVNLLEIKDFIDDYIKDKTITLNIALLNELSFAIKDITCDNNETAKKQAINNARRKKRYIRPNNKLIKRRLRIKR